MLSQSYLEKCGFHKLGIESSELFSKYLAKMEPGYASTMSFASMLAWRKTVLIYYMEAEGYLQAVACDTCHRRVGWLPLIGDYENVELGSALSWQIDMTRKAGCRYLATDVSRHMIHYYNESLPVKFLVKCDAGDSDYIYRLDDFVSMLNSQEVRYNYNYFIRKFEPVVEELKPRHLERCTEFIAESWCCAHSCEECAYGCQKDTAACIISEIEQSGANGIAVFSKGKMVGYCIVSQENQQLIFLFKKTKHGVRGINEFLHKECIERFVGSADIVNYTEDMNIEGLRAYKQRLCKYELFPRYTLTGKTEEVENQL